MVEVRYNYEFSDGDGYMIVPVQTNHISITTIIGCAFEVVAHCCMPHHFPDVGFVVDAVALLADPKVLAGGRE